MTDISEVVQLPSPDAIVLLFQLDLTKWGAGTVYFSPSFGLSSQPVHFGGQIYAAVPVDVEGFETTGEGPIPKPKLRISNVSNLISGLLAQYDDLLGAKLTRIRTFARYLDTGSEPDPTQIMPPDVFFIARRSSLNAVSVEFELNSALDLQDVKIPRRQIMRDYCPWRYRQPDGSGGFVYWQGSAACPYTGNTYFDAQGNQTDAAGDNCGKHLHDCILRYGSTDLPFGGFPGVAPNS